MEITDIMEYYEYQNNYENELHLIGKSKDFLTVYYDLFGIVEAAFENVVETAQPTTFQAILHHLEHSIDLSGNTIYLDASQSAIQYFQTYLVPNEQTINHVNYAEIDSPFQERYKYVMYAIEYCNEYDLTIFNGFDNTQNE